MSLSDDTEKAHDHNAAAAISPLPPGWVHARVEELLVEKTCNGISVKGSDEPPGVPALRLSAMTNTGFDYTELRYIPISPDVAAALSIRDGDLFVSRGNGSLHLLGRATLAQEPPGQVVFPDTMIRLRLAAFFPLRRFVRLAWLDRRLRRQIEAKARTTAGIYKISQRDVEQFVIPVPPLREQERIVAKLEELLSNLDAGVAALNRATAKLKRYRASVLKAAIEGRLTAEWRAKHPHTEPASKLLDRILAERRRRWEAEQEAKFAAAEKTPPKNWLEKYPEPIRPDPKDVPPLPDGWCWATVDQITANFDGIRVPVKAADRATRQGKYPYYGASGVIDAVDGYLFDGEYLLIAEDGANLLSRSTPIAFQAAGRFWVNNHAHIIQLFSGMPLAYLEHYLNGTRLDFFITGTAQPKLTQASLNKIPVPLPPIAEQQQIVAEVEQRLTVITANGQQIDADLKRAVRLRQSLLKRAFEGKLVPQDPTDDPASVLLERIRADRLSTSTGGPHADARNGQPAMRTARRRG